jgi:hypothetical protein
MFGRFALLKGGGENNEAKGLVIESCCFISGWEFFNCWSRHYSLPGDCEQPAKCGDYSFSWK